MARPVAWLKWDETTCDSIKERYTSGSATKHIAQELGLSYGAVRRYLLDNRILDKRLGGYTKFYKEPRTITPKFREFCSKLEEAHSMLVDSRASLDVALYATAGRRWDEGGLKNQYGTSKRDLRIRQEHSLRA
jgi:hypothetical protein